MIILLIIGIILGAVEVCRYASSANQQKQIDKLKADSRARAAESARYREEWRQQKAEALEMQRRQRKLEEEQERQAKEQEKLAERVEKLEWTVEKSARDISDLDEQLADFYGQLDSYLLQQAGMVPGSTQFNKLQDKIVTKRGQIRRAENKRFALKHTHDMAERELSA